MKLSLNNIAQSLDIPANTLERWIRQGRIPIQQSTNEFFFNKTNLINWAKKHNLTFVLPDQRQQALPLLHSSDTLYNALNLGGIFYNVKGDSVASALRSVVDLLPGQDDESRKQLYLKLLEREQLTSTGIGKGVAIPHPRTPLMAADFSPSITVCFLDKEIDFHAVDDNPVFALFTLLSPSVKLHLHLLSRLAFCFRDNNFIDFLKTAPVSQAILARFETFEKQLDS